MTTRRLTAVAALAVALAATGCGAQGGLPAATTPAPTPIQATAVEPATAEATVAAPENERTAAAELTADVNSAQAEACAAAEAHPLAQSIAGRYDTSADEVMAWYCGGSSFEDILLALETTAQTDVPVEDVLQRRAQGRTWDDIWQELGLID